MLREKVSVITAKAYTWTTLTMSNSVVTLGESLPMLLHRVVMPAKRLVTAAEIVATRE